MSIQVINQVIYRQHQLTFGEYLKLPGVSHSDIRAMQRKKPIVTTEKMNLGVKVHNYLLEPEKYEHEGQVVKDIAVKLKERIGPLIEFLEPEVAITADFIYDGWVMKWRGRIDLYSKRIIVDIKVINGKSVRDTMIYLGYPSQLSGYALGASAPVALIAAYSTKTKKVEIVNIPITTAWWEEQIILNGH